MNEVENLKNEMKNLEERKEFEELLLRTGRPGVDDLIEYCRKSDFYTAPASTQYHMSEYGGLLHHSLDVYEALSAKFRRKGAEMVISIGAQNGPIQIKYLDESVIIVSLLHDLCKTFFYSVGSRNVKNEETGKWEKVPFYRVDDRMPLGHGEKSVLIAQKYIDLTPDEVYAIRWHMGYSEPSENWKYVSAAFEKCPLALLLHEADVEATHIAEVG